MSFVVADNEVEFMAGIAELDQQMARGITAAVGDAITSGAEEARTNHKFTSRSGALVGGIKSYMISSASPHGDGEAAGIIESTDPKSAMIEGGTRAHTIYPRLGHNQEGPLRGNQGRNKKPKKGSPAVNSSGVLAFYINGKLIVVPMVNHPGTAPDPFFKNGQDKAEVVLMEKIGALLDTISGGGNQ